MLSRRSWLTTLLALFGVRKAAAAPDVINISCSTVDLAKAGSETTEVIWFYGSDGVWKIVGSQLTHHPYPYWHGQPPFKMLDLHGIPESENPGIKENWALSRNWVPSIKGDRNG